MSPLPMITEVKQKSPHPVKVLQFGQGNFLRAFVCAFIETLNEETGFDGSIVIVKPTARGNLDVFKEQNSLYTVLTRGISQGETIDQTRIITSVADTLSPYTEYENYMAYAKSDTLRFVISNTTEAGIIYSETDRLEMTPPDSFPGKLTQFLYVRFRHFGGDPSKGLIMLPVELIDDNGSTLKAVVCKLAAAWNLPAEFTAWLDEACCFANTLVDRIVSGFPQNDAQAIYQQLGYTDKLLTAAEPFGLWVIEASQDVREELCLQEVDLPILFTDNYKPYKNRKVRILNGAHTASALLAFACGKQYVREMLEDDLLKQFIQQVLFEEIIPAMDMAPEISVPFANDILERFANPFINHALLSISLNSVSKWKARCLPSLLDYREKFGKLPSGLTFSLAALLQFYRGGEDYTVKDEADVLQFFADHKGCANETLVQDYLKQTNFHGLPTALQDEVAPVLIATLNTMDAIGPYETLKEFIHENLHSDSSYR